MVAAQRAAVDYPGGVNAFMKDWIGSVKGRPVAASRQKAFEKATVDFFIKRNQQTMWMPEGPLKERTMFGRHGFLRPAFPFLRSITQQSRVLAGFVDDGIEAVAKGDKRAAAQAAARLAGASVLVSFSAGHYTLPEPVWQLFDSVNPEASEQLKEKMEWLREHNLAFGRRDKELGPKPVPWIQGGNLFIASTAKNVVETAHDWQNIEGRHDPKAAVRASAQLLSMLLIDNVAHVEGLNNLSKLFSRMHEGFAGERKLSVYPDTTLPEKIVNAVEGRHQAPLYSGPAESDPASAFGDWFYGARRPEDTNTIDWAEGLPRDQ